MTALRTEPAAIDVLAALLRATDLRPGPVVDALFRRLVETVTRDPRCCPDDVDPRLLAEVQALCGRGEALLEEHWARRVAADPGSVAGFPYRDNYRELARGEYGALCRALGRSPRSVAFAGSGPLPLTAVELHRLDPRLAITCVDRDPVALALGARTVRALCRTPSRLRFRRAEAGAADYSRADVVLVAALVGADQQAKHDLLRAVSRTLRPGAVLAVRSVPADGRRWLYPRVDPAGLPRELAVLGEWDPPPGVVNSLLLLGRRAQVLGPGGNRRDRRPVGPYAGRVRAMRMTTPGDAPAT